MDDVESFPSPTAPQPLLPLPAQFVQAERGDRSDQRKTAGERIDQRQHGIAEGEPRQHDADDGIDERDEDRVRRHGDEIVETFAQCDV